MISPASISLLSLALTCATGQAAPAPASASSQGIAVPLSMKANHVARLAQPTADLKWLKATKAQVSRKYGHGDPHLRKRHVATDNLTDQEMGSLWTGPLTIGGQTFIVDWDTGSADLWVPAASCTSSGCIGKDTYTPSANSSELSGSFFIQYEDTTAASGVIYKDTVTVGNLTASSQVFSAVTFDNNSSPSDGISGLGFPLLAELNTSGIPFFNTLIAQKQVTSPVFSFKLSTNDSELYLGGINHALYNGSISYTPVLQELYWTVALDNVTINNKTVPISTNISIIDTGTTLIYGPYDDVTSIWAEVPGSAPAQYTLGPDFEGFYIYPCSSTPAVAISFGNTSFAISDFALNFGQISPNSTLCVGGIAGQDPEYGWLVGDVFLQGVYAIFDVGKSRVGFANPA